MPKSRQLYKDLWSMAVGSTYVLFTSLLTYSHPVSSRDPSSALVEVLALPGWRQGILEVKSIHRRSCWGTVDWRSLVVLQMDLLLLEYGQGPNLEAMRSITRDALEEWCECILVPWESKNQGLLLFKNRGGMMLKDPGGEEVGHEARCSSLISATFCCYR